MARLWLVFVVSLAACAGPQVVDPAVARDADPGADGRDDGGLYSRAVTGPDERVVTLPADPQGTKFVPERFAEPVLRDGYVRVVRVVDGDTVRVVVDGKEEALRLIGIQAPELMGRGRDRNDAGGYESALWLQERLRGDPQVRLEWDVGRRDRYGRLLAYLWAPPREQVGARPPPGGEAGAGERGGNLGGSVGGESMINEELIRAGHAKPYPYRPNVKYRERLERAAVRSE